MNDKLRISVYQLTGSDVGGDWEVLVKDVTTNKTPLRAQFSGPRAQKWAMLHASDVSAAIAKQGFV